MTGVQSSSPDTGKYRAKRRLRASTGNRQTRVGNPPGGLLHLVRSQCAALCQQALAVL